MGSGGHHMGVGHGRGVQPGGHQPCDMGHIHPQVGPHLVRDGPEPLEVNDPWIGGGPGDNHAGPALLGHPFQRVVVDASGGLVYAIGYHLKIFAGEVHRASVGQMAAVVQIHAQHRVPRLT